MKIHIPMGLLCFMIASPALADMVSTQTYSDQYATTNTGTATALPRTSLDSFVYESGGNADLIYGDEGGDGIPPDFSFTKEHRISQGITGARAAGLTTGHSSYLPDAWGGDEWTGNEWSMSGSGCNTGGHSNGGTGTGSCSGCASSTEDDATTANTADAGFGD